MFYALRRRAGSDRQTLVEFTGKSAFRDASALPGISFSKINADVAHRWVEQGKEHETGLFRDVSATPHGNTSVADGLKRSSSRPEKSAGLKTNRLRSQVRRTLANLLKVEHTPAGI